MVEGVRFKVQECEFRVQGVPGSYHKMYQLNGLRKSTPPQNRELSGVPPGLRAGFRVWGYPAVLTGAEEDRAPPHLCPQHQVRRRLLSWEVTDRKEEDEQDFQSSLDPLIPFNSRSGTHIICFLALQEIKATPSPLCPAPGPMSPAA